MVEIELIFAPWAAIPGIWVDFQNCHIWAGNLAIGQSSRSSTYTLLLPQGDLNWAYFHSTPSGSRDKGQFSKLQYLGMKLGHWPKFQKLHIYCLYTPVGLKLGTLIAYFSRYGRFSMKLGNWPKFQKLHIQYTVSLPRGWVKIELIFALWPAISEIWAHFQNCHIWAWNLAVGQSARSCTYTPSLRQGVKILSLFSLYRQRFRRYKEIFKIAIYLGMTLGHCPKCQMLHIYPLFTPGDGHWAYFRTTGNGFRDMGRLSKLPYLGMKLFHWPKCQMLHIYPLSTPGGGH